MNKYILAYLIFASCWVSKAIASDLIVPYSHFALRYSSSVKIIQLADSNFLMLSRHKDIGSTPAMAGLTWCHRNGDTIKTKLLTLNSGSAAPLDIISLYDGSLFISGTTDDPLDNTLFTIHLDSTGSLISFKLHTSIDAVWLSNSIQLDSGHVLLAATLVNVPESIIFYKVNPDGDSLSFHNYTFPGLLGVSCSRLLNDSTILFGGDMSNSNFVLLTNLNGDSLSIDTFPFTTSGKVHISSIAITGSQYLVIAGTSTDTLDSNHQSVWCMKTDLSGLILWQNRFHSANPFWNSSAISEIGTNYFAINTFYNTTTTIGNHPPVLIIDSNGDSVSMSNASGNYCEMASGNNNSIIGDMNGNAFLTTTIDSVCSNIYQNIAFEKFDFSSLVNSIDVLNNNHHHLDVFPNPANNHLNVIDFDNEIGHISLYDISGRFLFSKIKEESIQLPDIHNVVYVVVLYHKDRTPLKKIRLVVLH